MKIILFVVLLASCLVVCVVNKGQAFRCGNEVVVTGDSAVSLQKRCGPPSRTEYATQIINGRYQTVQKLYYNCGENDFIYVFSIANSQILLIDTQGRGTGVSECQGRLR